MEVKQAEGEGRERSGDGYQGAEGLEGVVIGRCCKKFISKERLSKSHAATSPRVTASHSNSEVKLGRAQAVLPSGRGREG